MKQQGNTMSRLKQFALFILIIIFLAAPFWITIAHNYFRVTIFLSADALVWLGIALLTTILGARLFPDSTLQLVRRTIQAVRNHFLSFAILFVGLTFLSLHLINRYILMRFMNSGDEHACYFLAECIKNGRWWATPHALPQFFEVVHVGNKNGKWFSVYPPGWPLLFALGLKFHISHWINPILSMIATIFFFKISRRVFGFASACLSTLLMCTTPFFLFNNASYFSHTTCFLAIALFLYFFLKWQDEGTICWAAISALCLGYGLSTRYLTMAAMAEPFIAYELFLLLRRQKRWSQSHAVFSIIILVMIFLNLYYNYMITGNFLDAPNHFYHRWERLGFHSDYTVLDASKYVVSRFFFLLSWISPALVFFYCISLLKVKGKTIRELLLHLAFLYPVVAYLFYYSWGGNQYGPRYYFEGLPFLTLSVSTLFLDWWKTKGKYGQKVVIGLFIVSIVSNGYFLAKQGKYYKQVSSERKSLYSLAEQQIKEPAIVFIHGFLGDFLVMAEEDAVRNNPNLQDKILYAHDRGEENKLLKRFYPDRIFYLGTYDRTKKQPQLQLLTQ